MTSPSTHSAPLPRPSGLYGKQASKQHSKSARTEQILSMLFAYTAIQTLALATTPPRLLLVVPTSPQSRTDAVPVRWQHHCVSCQGRDADRLSRRPVQCPEQIRPWQIEQCSAVV
ncbi:hypothetical protein MPTK2_3g03940 [Marchantia polymorpha subsp. ruderalis]